MGKQSVGGGLIVARRDWMVVVSAVLAVIGAMLLALGGSPASAATNPNLDGCWNLHQHSTALLITSGTATTITGDDEDINPDIDSAPDPCSGGYPTGSLSGSISDGSGVIHSSQPEGWVVTGVAGTTMTGFSYGEGPSPPSSYAQCEQDAQVNEEYSCYEFTATNVSPPSQATPPTISDASKKGTTLKLKLSAAATVKVVVKNKNGKKVKTLTFSGVAGSNSFKLNLKGLKKGSYTAVITASDAGGASGKTELKFKIKS
jgi:hypothetical protein